METEHDELQLVVEDVGSCQRSHQSQRMEQGKRNDMVEVQREVAHRTVAGTTMEVDCSSMEAK